MKNIYLLSLLILFQFIDADDLLVYTSSGIVQGYKDGKIKSLGSWGGDFILVTTKNKDLTYFRNRGLNTIIPLKDMVYLG